MADVPIGDARRVRVYSLVVFVEAGHGAIDGRWGGREKSKGEVGGWRMDLGWSSISQAPLFARCRPGRSLVILCWRGWLTRAVVVEAERYSDLPFLLQLHAACNMYSSSCLSARQDSARLLLRPATRRANRIGHCSVLVGTSDACWDE